MPARRGEYFNYFFLLDMIQLSYITVSKFCMNESQLLMSCDYIQQEIQYYISIVVVIFKQFQI